MEISTPVRARVYPGPGYIAELVDGQLFEVDRKRKNAIITDTLIPIVWPLIQKRAKNYTHDKWTYGLTYYTYISYGSTLEIPKPFTSKLNFKVKSNNGKLWQAAKSDPTIIVVSPYNVGTVDIIVEPKVSDSYITHDKYTSPNLLDLGFVPVKSGPAQGLFQIGSYYFVTTGHIAIDFEWFKRVFTPPPPLLANDLYGKIRGSFCKDPGLVTSTVAKADTACMDVLTALAELPETARSILSGFSMVVNAIKDLKKGRLSLSKAHEKRLQYIQKKNLLTISQLELKLKNARSPGESRYFKRKIDQANRNLSITRQRAIEEFTTALASIWMNFRYNIMPNIYMIEDLQNLVDSYFATFHTERDKLVSSVKVELNTWKPVEVEIRHHCVIKRLIDPNLRFSSLTSANFAKTLYELMPLSFVVDWFINIGDIITAVSSPNYSLREGAVYGWKVSSNFTMKHEAGFVANIKMDILQRDVIDPSNHIGLSLNWDLSLFRKLDALALIWNPIRKLLQNSR